MAARRQALRLAARALEQRLNADVSDYAGPELPCSCGQPAQYRGRHEKTFESVLGPLRLERAYYRCAPCEGGFCPRDRALRLDVRGGEKRYRFGRRGAEPAEPVPEPMGGDR
jgi:hypothetical protein